MTDWSHIASTLRRTRESRKLSVHDVSHTTRIPVKALHELEEGDLSGFASPAYAKSFLSQYCRFLDVDAEDWLDQFEIPAEKLDLDPLSVLDFDDPEEEGEAVAGHHRRHHAPPVAEPAQPRRTSAAIQPIAVFLATAMLLAAGTYGFMRLSERLGEVSEAQPPASPGTPPPAERTPESALPLNNAPSPPLAANETGPASRSGSGGLSDDLAQPLVIESQPPRAVIVEE